MRESPNSGIYLWPALRQCLDSGSARTRSKAIGMPRISVRAEWDYPSGTIILAPLRIPNASAQYRDHVAKMLSLLGDSPEAADAAGDVVMRIETRWPKHRALPCSCGQGAVQQENAGGTDVFTPRLNWDLYLKTLDAASRESLSASRNSSSASTSCWRRFPCQIGARTCVAIDPFEGGFLNGAGGEDFHFYSEVMRGIKQMQPRWKRAIGHG